MSRELIFLIPLLPLAGALLNMLGGRIWSRRSTETVAVAAVAAATLATALLWPLAAGEGTTVELFTWLQPEHCRCRSCCASTAWRPPWR
jgi:NADH-quinone oxidoreductase subunit L